MKTVQFKVSCSQISVFSVFAKIFEKERVFYFFVAFSSVEVKICFQRIFSSKKWQQAFTILWFESDWLICALSKGRWCHIYKRCLRYDRSWISYVWWQILISGVWDPADPESAMSETWQILNQRCLRPGRSWISSVWDPADPESAVSETQQILNQRCLR